MASPRNGLTGPEIISLVQQVYNLLKLLTQSEALAGIILTDASYEAVRDAFGNAGMSYAPGEIDLDPRMEQSFVVDGMLILRGTTIQ